MQNHIDTQRINSYYRSTRDELYETLRGCEVAHGLSNTVKHELVQWALLQWVALNEQWTSETDRNWEVQEPLPYEADVVKNALSRGLESWKIQTDVLDEPSASNEILRSILVFCEQSLVIASKERSNNMEPQSMSVELDKISGLTQAPPAM